MYLQTVLSDISYAKTLHAEDLYKLSEAVFNIPEEDVVDSKMAAKVFQALKKINQAYTSGQVNTKSDGNFFYDYVALLGTMQNQHFLSNSQNKQVLDWMQQALGGPTQQPQKQQPQQAKSDPKLEKKVKELEAENNRLRAEVEKFKGMQEAVLVIQKFKVPKSASEIATKEAGKGEKANAAPKAKGSGKGTGGGGKKGSGKGKKK